MPDARIAVEDLIAEGDRVAGRFTLHGTHTGPFLHLAATGHSVRVDIIDINRVAGGRIVERWGQTDTLALLEQLNVAPTPTAAANLPRVAQH
jgi:predicted ester cyclase